MTRPIYYQAKLTRADLTQADLTQGRVDPHSFKIGNRILTKCMHTVCLLGQLWYLFGYKTVVYLSNQYYTKYVNQSHELKIISAKNEKNFFRKR